MTTSKIGVVYFLMLHAINWFVLSVDRAALLDYRSFAPPLTDRAVRRVNGETNTTIALTTDSTALSVYRQQIR